ncbi:MAG: glycosyltransferase [Bacteroidetes bacterium]|nr:glycosyltransferase [Bacteroidota bacterium]MBP9547846.1 glycosyltransferase [Chitinophagales bacterium]
MATLCIVILIIASVLFIYEIYALIQSLLLRKKLPVESLDNYSLISVIIPARNEGKKITACLESICNVDYPPDKLEIIVVNDQSTDNTESIIQTFANKFKNLKLITITELPSDWSGKSNACHTASESVSGEYLCFIDADVIVKKQLFKQAVAYSINHDMGVLSLIPHMLAKSFIEKILLLPVFVMTATALRNSNTTLNGQFILFKTSVYKSIGGHTLVKNTVAEDLEFAIYLSDKKYAVAFLFAEHLFDCRMYDSYNSLSKGISKMLLRLLRGNVFKALFLSSRYLIIMLGFISAIVLFFLQGITTISLLFLLLPVSVITLCIGLSIYFKITPFWGLLMPIGWIYQPVFFYKSILGKYRHYYEWRGRRVYDNAN